MSFFIAGCVLLVALIAGIVLDNNGVGRWQKPRRDVSSFDAW
ncbi:MAG: hypothetical protein P4L90_25310 [Rhodopila sp.]|nr:hypothetical protein [Rhodopila sp.]